MKMLVAAAVCSLAIVPALGSLPSTAEPKRGPVPVASGTGLGQYAHAAGRAEGFAAYVPQTSCDPKWRKGIKKFRDLVLQRYPKTQDWGSVRNCTDDGISEHLDGRAWDWHADAKDPAGYAAATDLINWLMAKGPDGKTAYWARRLGIMYIGYNKKIWGSYRASEGWRKLTNSNPHTDHVHFSFSWAGAFGKTSFWDGTVAGEDYGPCRPFAGEPAGLHTRRSANARPCSYPPRLTRTASKPGRLLWRGSSSKEVLALQQALNVPGANGFFGPATMRAVAEYQRRNSLTPSGAVDTLTRASLVRSGVLKR
jgi:peptidoglycan hydrolase-like protein with peptidoglycan-binding domain